MIPNDSKESIGSVQLSLDIIDVIHERGGARFSELLRDVDCARTTLHNHLNTLIDNHYVVKDGNYYQIGFLFYNYGINRVNNNRNYKRAKQKARETANLTAEEVNFSVEEHGRMLTLFAEIESVYSGGFDRGEFLYMHCSAAGKAVLAEWPEEDVRAVLDYWGMPKMTENTITDQERLLEQLEHVSDQGFAVNDEEHKKGLHAVGVPVTYPNGSVFGVIDVSGPAYRLPSDEDIAEILNEKAEELAEEISIQDSV